MKILFLSRTVKNGGDFLYAGRAKEILKHNLPYAEIVCRHMLDEVDLPYINSFDKIIISGGPLYDDRFLTSNATPCFAFLDKMKPTIHFFGVGWYGENAFMKTIYTYRFHEEVLANLRLIEKKGGTFSCRDYITAKVLRNNGLNHVYMTGCPAWYDLKFLPCMSLKKTSIQNVKNLVISDMGMTKDSSYHSIKIEQVKKLVEFIESTFSQANIVFTFNGGVDTKYSGEFNRAVCKYLGKKHIMWHDLSGSMDGFHVYDNIDLHIGYRVHSHIYCLSHRIPTILIEEDARGAGINQALGLPAIQNYNFDTVGRFQENPFLFLELMNYIEELDCESMNRIQLAVLRMATIYSRTVQPYIQEVFGV